MYCKINNGKINFYQETTGKGMMISKKLCVHIMKEKIKKYVKSKGCYIKFLNNSELKIINKPSVLNKVCEQNDNIASILSGDIDDILDEKIPNRFIVGLFNKQDDSLLSISSIYKKYEESPPIKGGMYFSASCSAKQDPKIIKASNYFIRAFSILELLENNKFDIIWGIMGGDVEVLKAYHERVGCSSIPNPKSDVTLIYKCEIVNFLNKFFEWLEELINSE